MSWLRRGETANEDVARLRVLDRQLMLGDVVARADGSDSGQVRERRDGARPRVMCRALVPPSGCVAFALRCPCWACSQQRTLS